MKRKGNGLLSGGNGWAREDILYLGIWRHTCRIVGKVNMKTLALLLFFHPKMKDKELHQALGRMISLQEG